MKYMLIVTAVVIAALLSGCSNASGVAGVDGNKAAAAPAQEAPPSGNPYENDPAVTVYRDVVYGQDGPDQQVLDAYILKSERPTPVLVHVHAGWSLSKHGMRTFYNKRENLFRQIKAAGISVVSITHRDAAKYGFPAPMIDTGRAVQFIRSKAAEWNIDPQRIAAIGGSGGGHCSTWVALHDDLAKADSVDPVARQSSRLQCVVPMWTPVDFTRFTPSGEGWTGNVAAMVAGAGKWKVEDYNQSAKSREDVRTLSLTTSATKDDPPVLLVYDFTKEMLAKDHSAAPVVINDPHHGWHGVLLADALKAAGVEHVMLGDRDGEARDRTIVDFLVKHLKSTMASALPEPQLYGLYCSSESYMKYADDVRKVGIRWLRVGGLSGKTGDEAALLAARTGVHLVPGLGLGVLSHAKDKVPPLDEILTQWREVVRGAVQRYGPGGNLWKENQDAPALPIRYWEIWNEPNIGFLSPPEGINRAELYAKLLTIATEEIRRLDPGAKIVAFNTAGGTPDHGQALKADGMFEKLKYMGWRKFLRDSVTLAGPDGFDAVGLHPYTQPRGPEEGGVIKGLEMLGEVSKELEFADKPVWFTEVGSSLEYPNSQQVRDERQQACFTVRLFAIAGAHGVAQVQIMYITDIVYRLDNTKRSFGFFTAPGKWREQATATEVMIGLIPDPRKDARILSEEQGGVFSYQFKGGDGSPVIMAWTTGKDEVEREFELAGKGATLVDMLGKRSPVEAPGGKIKVTLGEAPVYLVPNVNGLPSAK